MEDLAEVAGALLGLLGLWVGWVVLLWRLPVDWVRVVAEGWHGLKGWVVC